MERLRKGFERGGLCGLGWLEDGGCLPFGRGRGFSQAAAILGRVIGDRGLG